MTSALERAEATLEAADGEGAEEDLEKVRRLKRVYDRSGRAVDVLASTSTERVVEVLGKLEPG